MKKRLYRHYVGLTLAFFMFAVILTMTKYDYSFSFLKEATYWAMVIPMLMLVTIFKIMLRFESKDKG